ncbi:hypothetical protein [Thalassotalea sp. SU-HH00458]|uniref:hypothetical protein n=1 Tax=Thalassotalea sp. SU-HH00458 TaxID=3127657 RepID=UPI00310C4275
MKKPAIDFNDKRLPSPYRNIILAFVIMLIGMFVASGEFKEREALQTGIIMVCVFSIIRLIISYRYSKLSLLSKNKLPFTNTKSEDELAKTPKIICICSFVGLITTASYVPLPFLFVSGIYYLFIRIKQLGAQEERVRVSNED